MNNFVVIFPDPGAVSVQFDQPQSVVVDFGASPVAGPKGEVGPQGPQGIPGPNEIGGFPVVLEAPKEADALLLKSSAWRNVAQEALTDGGNF